MKKILIVDDEPSIVTLLSFNLEKEGYAVSTASDGETGLKKILTSAYDFVILDLMLPKLDGVEVCRRVRQEKVDVPILMLTAKSSEIDKIIGLELGADDYMTKPFSPREVLARMKAIFRRSEHKKETDHAPVEETIRFNELEVYPDQFEVRVNGKKIALTPKEYELLHYLASHPGKVFSREQLLQRVWDFGFEGETRIVDMHISNLREKMERNGTHRRRISTVRGFGYKFEADPS